MEVLFMKPVNSGGHPAYQSSLISRIMKYYPDFMVSIDLKMMKLANLFFQLDLSYVDPLMQDRYSDIGRPPRLPSCMLRSVMLSLMLKIPSFTDWVVLLRRIPLYAIISGFDPDDIPGIGTFYDFYKRLWLSGDPNMSPNIRLPRKKPAKPPKGQKAEPVDKITVEELINQYKTSPFSTEQPYSLLFSLYYNGFLKNSSDRGMVDLDDLEVAGDGTPVYTSARLRSRKLLPEEAQASRDPENERSFSQPDCCIGWDSSRECYYFGYDLYLFTAKEAGSGKTLPVFPLLHRASMHDSIGFVHAYFATQGFLHPGVSKLYLDSAHDNMATYRLCQENKITPFICLNLKGAKTFEEQGITINEDGVPICMAGKKLTRDGIEKKRARIKYRCPYAWSSIHNCPYCDQCCSTGYGKVVHTATKDNPRFFNIPPRDSDEWKAEYKSRTASERDNKRIKMDYLLEAAHHRSTRYWYCRLYCVLMCIHADAWDIPTAALKNRLKATAE